jgi:hypothetical protein
MATTLEQVVSMVMEDDLEKQDIRVDRESILMNNDGDIVLNGESILRPTDWALSQVLSRANCPVRYGKWLPEHLRFQVVNYGIGHYERDLTLRTKGDLLRAVVSEDYRPFDNRRIVEALTEILPGRVNFEVERVVLDDRAFHINLILPDIAEDMRRNGGRPDIIRAGVLIGNSEVGASSVFVLPRLLRQICTNGMVAWVGGGDGELRMPHKGHGEFEMEAALARGIAEAARAGDEALNNLRSLIVEEVSEPLKILEELARKRGLSGRFTDNAKSELEGNTAYDVLNAVTAAARGVENPERRIEIEAFAGFLAAHPELIDLGKLLEIESFPSRKSPEDN